MTDPDSRSTLKFNRDIRGLEYRFSYQQSERVSGQVRIYIFANWIL